MNRLSLFLLASVFIVFTANAVHGQLTADEIDTLLTRHNFYRHPLRLTLATNPALPTMAWDPVLAARAQTFVSECTGAHSNQTYRANVGSGCPSNGMYKWVGENRAWGPTVTVSWAVDAWAGEQPNYNFADLKCAAGQQCGHWTQMVWRSTTFLGCGKALCGTNIQILCQYGSAGNFGGQLPYAVCLTDCPTTVNNFTNCATPPPSKPAPPPPTAPKAPPSAPKTPPSAPKAPPSAPKVPTAPAPKPAPKAPSAPAKPAAPTPKKPSAPAKPAAPAPKPAAPAPKPAPKAPSAPAKPAAPTPKKPSAPAKPAAPAPKPAAPAPKPAPKAPSAPAKPAAPAPKAPVAPPARPAAPAILSGDYGDMPMSLRPVKWRTQGLLRGEGSHSEEDPCGNGTIDADEECDTAIQTDPRTCKTLGYAAGPLRCGDRCVWDTSACVNVGTEELVIPQEWE